MNKKKDYTFKYNEDLGRHGWLRLTPAYSIILVEELLDQFCRANPDTVPHILDPFSGTATTGIVAAEKGMVASLYDINPFLVWFGNTKATNFDSSALDKALSKLKKEIISLQLGKNLWKPSIKNIERWWSPITLESLSSIRSYLSQVWGEPSERDLSNLFWIAFAKLCISVSSADFNHVSMSFQEGTKDYSFEDVKLLFLDFVVAIVESAKQHLPGKAVVYLADSRYLPVDEKYDLVITSPPYPNRISYIRELRPYMYWLKFLSESKEAGELDWKAIGGTWGSATSKLKIWNQVSDYLPSDLLVACEMISRGDDKNGDSMGRYVHKFFDDLFLHLSSLRNRLNDGASIHYIIGNSFFYGVHVDTEAYVRDILEHLGYSDIDSTIIRKRNSKKGLYEYNISAVWKCKS